MYMYMYKYNVNILYATMILYAIICYNVLRHTDMYNVNHTYATVCCLAHALVVELALGLDVLGEVLGLCASAY